MSLPADEPPGVEAAPPYLRGALAFHHAPGPFDPVPPSSFRYYLTPPWPSGTRSGPGAGWPCSSPTSWPSAPCTRPTRATTPTSCTCAGPAAGSRPPCTARSSARAGAHYWQEAAFDAGFRAGDPEAEVAMRTDALVRVARLLVAVGMHTQGMTLEEATAEFETTAGLDPDHARLEAVRGTWDPGYFGYTLGKLEILKLRDQVGGDLGSFHDALLANGTPPPAIAARHLLPG